MFPLWKIYQNVQKSSLLSKIVSDNAKLFIYVKKADLFAEKMNMYWLIYLSALSQLLDAFSGFERNLQDDFLENFQNFCRVRYCTRIENGDFFAEVIMSLLDSFYQ